MPANCQTSGRIGISDSLPAWSRETVTRVRSLADLQENWDSYGARPIDPLCAQAAIDLILSVLRPGVPAPAVVPTSRGGVQLEWHRGGVDLEIEIESRSRFHALNCVESTPQVSLLEVMHV